MKYRLALDVGTSSIGLVAYALDETHEPAGVCYHAVRIFAEPLLPAKTEAVGQPKKSARREARQQRRQVERRARQLRRIAHCLPLLGLDAGSVLPDPLGQIHELRARAVTERIELPDLARILLKLAKRRGYAGGFKLAAKPAPEGKGEGKARPKADEEDTGIVKAGIEKLKAEMAACGAETVGQYLAWRMGPKGPGGVKLKEAGLYAHRDMLIDEFERIWRAQAHHHPVLRDPAVEQVFRAAIFFQRPLKSPAAMVGNCQLEPDLPRAPMAQPAAQSFRIEKQLADLRWGMGRVQETLTRDQREVIRGLLRDKAKTSFDAIYKALEKAGCPKPLGKGLNMDRPSREELRGDRTRAALRKMGLLEDWERLDALTQRQIINFIADLGSPEQLADQDWPERFLGAKGKRRTFTEPFKGFINAWIATGHFARLGAMDLDAGRSSYSVKALEKLTEIMREQGLDERHAIEKAYPEHVANKALHAELPPPPKTGNVVVDVALQQLNREIARCMRALGTPPAEVIVELAREMALGRARRNEIETENDRHRRAREKAVSELQSHGLEGNRTNITKFLLWKEQEGRCPYCDHLLGLTEIADGHASHIEHILPRSLTRVGRKRDQIVVAHAQCNDIKGDRTPWQAFGGEPPADRGRWLAVLAMAERFKNKRGLAGKARLLRLDDWEGASGEAAVRDFAERQFHETSWIAKLTAQWLRSICSRVQVSRGEMTAYLRRIWHLETVIPEIRYQSGLPVYDTEGKPVSKEEFERHKAFWEGKPDQCPEDRTDRRIDKRKDHRHHLIDALVIGLSTPKLYQRMAREYQRRAEQPELGRKPRYSLAVEPPLKDLRAIALDLVSSCRLTHKPDRWPSGPLFKETAYGVAEIKPDGVVRMRLGPAELRSERLEGAHRVLIARKRLADLADDRTSVEQARRKLGDIASPGIRSIVSAEFERRVAEGVTARAALSKPIFNPEYRTEIKAVKLRHGDADDAFPVFHRSRSGEHYKLLQHEGYACLQVSTLGKGVKVDLVRPADRLRRSANEQPPEVRCFFKGDSVRDTKDQRMFLIKQIKAQGGGSLFMVPLTDAREIAETKSNDGRRIVSGRRLLDLEVLGCPNIASS